MEYLQGVDLQDFGTSMVIGFCSGYTLKKVSKLMALGIGVGFLGLKTAEAQGWIHSINWSGINETFVKHGDFNQDGKFDAQDFVTGLDCLKTSLGVGSASVAGFGSGFSAGIYLG